MQLSYPIFEERLVMRLAALTELSPSDRAKLREAAQSSFVISEEKPLKLSGPSGRSRLLVLDGWLARSTSHRDGRRQIIGFYVPGDVITPGTALNFAITTDLTSVGQATLCPAPEGQSLASAYVAAAAVEQAYLHRQVVRLGRMNAFERVEDWMWEMRDRLLLSGMAQPEAFQLPITQDILADVLGLTPVHVNRTLKLLREVGVLTWRSGYVRFAHEGAPSQMACEELGRRTSRTRNGAPTAGQA